LRSLFVFSARASHVLGSMGSQDDLQDSRHDEQTAKPKLTNACDPISGLRAPTVFGRPNWDKIFDDVVAECVAAAVLPVLTRLTFLQTQH
jgi:hypothetical protein